MGQLKMCRSTNDQSSRLQDVQFGEWKSPDQKGLWLELAMLRTEVSQTLGITPAEVPWNGPWTLAVHESWRNISGVKTVPQLTTATLTLAKPASLIRLCAINPTSLLTCIQQPCLSAQLYIINWTSFRVGLQFLPQKPQSTLSRPFSECVCHPLFA